MAKFDNSSAMRFQYYFRLFRFRFSSFNLSKFSFQLFITTCIAHISLCAIVWIIHRRVRHIKLEYDLGVVNMLRRWYDISASGTHWIIKPDAAWEKFHRTILAIQRERERESWLSPACWPGTQLYSGPARHKNDLFMKHRSYTMQSVNINYIIHVTCNLKLYL